MKMLLTDLEFWTKDPSHAPDYRVQAPPQTYSPQANLDRALVHGFVLYSREQRSRR